MSSTEAQLRQRIKQLEDQLAGKDNASSMARDKIEKMSSEVVDSNPYR